MNDRIRNLDGLRGVAILLVLGGHVIANYQPLDPEWRRWLGAFTNPGAGVRLFFVLSGYLITHLLLREHDTTGSISISRFYQRRIRRIFPAFFLYLFTLTALSFWRPNGVNPQTFFAAASFTWNYQDLWVTPPPEGTWHLGHLWTLALEQQFYLLWPWGLALLPRRAALWMAIVLVVWCPVARVGSYWLFPSLRGIPGMMFHDGVDSIMAGCATALLLDSGTWQNRLRCHGNRFAVPAVVWLVVFSPLVGEAVHGFPVAAGFTLDALAASALVAWAHHAAGSWSRRMLGAGILPALGLISYSLYLWQQIFLSPSGWLASGRVVEPLLGAVVVASASYFFVEKPWLRRRPPPFHSAATVLDRPIR